MNEMLLTVVKWIVEGALGFAVVIVSVALATRPLLRPLHRDEMVDRARTGFVDMLYLRAFLMDRRLTGLDRDLYELVQAYSSRYVHEVAVVALGGSGDPNGVPRLGTTESEWRQTFYRLAFHAHFIMLVPLLPREGPVVGLMAEIDSLVDKKEKLILVMPARSTNSEFIPLPSDFDLAGAWNAMADELERIDGETEWPRYHTAGAFFTYSSRERGWRRHAFAKAELESILEDRLRAERKEAHQRSRKILDRLLNPRKRQWDPEDV